MGHSALAQTEQGTYLTGGDLGVNTANNNTSILLNPTIGYFFLPNLVVGGNLTFTYSKVGKSSDAVKTTTFGVGPFARYYFGTMSLRPFFHGDVNFLSQKTKIGSNPTTSNGATFLVGGGLAAFLYRNVALETVLGYSHTRFAKESSNGGLSLKVGFQVYLTQPRVTSE